MTDLLKTLWASPLFKRLFAVAMFLAFRWLHAKYPWLGLTLGEDGWPTLPKDPGEGSLNVGDLGTLMLGKELLTRTGDIAPKSSGIPLIGLCFALALSGCFGAHGPVNWPKVLSCGPGVSDLVGTVSRVLLGDGSDGQRTISERAKSELTDLAAEHGAQTIACLVATLVHGWTAPGAAQHPTRLAAAARGQDFLDQIGVEADTLSFHELPIRPDQRSLWRLSVGPVPPEGRPRG